MWEHDRHKASSSEVTGRLGAAGTWFWSRPRSGFQVQAFPLRAPGTGRGAGEPEGMQ